jgi:hypothetical protein
MHLSRQYPNRTGRTTKEIRKNISKEETLLGLRGIGGKIKKGQNQS